VCCIDMLILGLMQIDVLPAVALVLSIRLASLEDYAGTAYMHVWHMA
jgi:hypothetical protein